MVKAMNCNVLNQFFGDFKPPKIASIDPGHKHTITLKKLQLNQHTTPHTKKKIPF